MLVTLHLSASLDAELRGNFTGEGRSGKSNSPFSALLTSHALEPSPLFPEAINGTYSSIWHVQVPDKDAKSIVEQFLRIPGMEAAYTKPAESAPDLA